MNIEISLPKMHAGQKAIEAGLKRFNVVNCGRRFGKTQYGFDKLIDPALDGYPAAWFAPSYRTLKEVWDKALTVLSPIIARSEVQSKAIYLITGGKLEFWSLDNPAVIRGRKYKRVIVDEAAHVKNMADIWGKVLRPLLTDYQGDAFFLSTPNGKHNFFYELSLRKEKSDNWSYFQMPTAANPFIVQEEIDEASKELDRLTFAQEYLAEFVDFVGMPFAHAFDEQRHIGYTAFDPSLPLILSFDFGVDPMPAVACQVSHFPKEVRVIKEFAIYDGDIYRLMTSIKAWVSTLPGSPIIKVTGDPSGQARNALSQGAANAYRVLMEGLGIRKDYIKVPQKFSISNSRTLVNSILEHLPVVISPECKGLIRDLKFVEVDKDGFGAIKLKKTGKNEAAGTSNEMLTHILDAFRYMLHLEFYDFSSKLRI